MSHPRIPLRTTCGNGMRSTLGLRRVMNGLNSGAAPKDCGAIFYCLESVSSFLLRPSSKLPLGMAAGPSSLWITANI